MTDIDPTWHNPEAFQPVTSHEVYQNLYSGHISFEAYEVIEAAVGLPLFTHWLLFPETDDYFPFIKAVTLDRHTNREGLEKANIKIFSISNRPKNYPTKPKYKPESEHSIESKRLKLEAALINSQ